MQINPWTFIVGIVSIATFVFAVFLQFNSGIDKKIESRVNDPEFIRKIVSQTRFPFIIFDEDESTTDPTDAMNLYIDTIKVHKGERQLVSEIIVSPKKWMAVPPMLESLDGWIQFQDPIRGPRFDFIYKVSSEQIKFITGKSAENPPKRKFKLQLVILPKP